MKQNPYRTYSHKDMLSSSSVIVVVMMYVRVTEGTCNRHVHQIKSNFSSSICFIRYCNTTTMRGFSVAVLALVALASENALAFTPTNFHQVSARRSMSITVSTSATDNDVDVSIPYDAAARLEYDQWRTNFKKGDFNDARYATFKANYEAITVSNVAAKKKAREEGGDAPSMLLLNEYGDFTFDEYEKAMGGDSSDPKSSGGVLGKAMEAAESAAAASSALQDAANALAEEEEVGFI
jgi:hypothetical protein